MMDSKGNPSETAEMFDDLVRDILQVTIPVVLGLYWIWTTIIVLFNVPMLWTAYLAFLILIAGSVGCYWVYGRHLIGAVCIYLAGLIATMTVMTIAHHDIKLFYLYLQVVLVAGLLTTPAVMWVTAGIVIALTLGVGTTLGFGLPELILPAIMMFCTALIAWLGSRRLFMAIAWATNMFDRAQQSAAQAREHRAELQRLLRTLDIAYARLERANQALIFAQEAADKAYRFKSDFVANVSHELRTPLNLVVGFSEMMATAPESYGGVPLPREYRGDVMAIYRSGRHLLDLINDVLDLSQIEAGQMAIAKETIALKEVVSEAVEIVRGLAEARGLRLELDLPATPVWLELDRTRIRQVLLNLLTNAMRYTEAGYVRVAVQLEANQVIIAVEDSGRGISPEHLTRAFEAFSRLDEQDLRDGSGLGLAVSKKFVELHGGTMSIESELNRGTKVSFSLPLLDHTALLARPHTASGRPLRNGSRQPVVLVLHDDRRILDLLQRHIGTCSFVLTDSPAQVGRLIQEQLPTLILMGATWAEGYGAAQDIQALLSQIPVITCPLPSMHTLGRHLGATDYLPKPVLREDLAASLARLPRRPQTALIVDDDPHVVRLIVRMLAAIDPAIQVREAFGGEAGLAIARSQRPDVIFLDLVMPQLNGYRLMEEISADQSLAHTAVIVVSVRSVDQESARLPGELWLRRPNGFSLTEVLQTLNVMLASITQPDGASPTSAAAQLEIAAG